MTELGLGEVVRISVIGESADEVDQFSVALAEDSGLSEILTPMPHRWQAQNRDFGTWELAVEFIVSATSGATSVAITEGVRALWKRLHVGNKNQLPSPPPQTGQSQPGMTVHPEQIAAGPTNGGVTEIIIHLHND